jgi:RNA polymerase sigma factor (sigma-70 family)
MDALPSLKKEWSLTQEAFDGLLSCLDSEPEQAAQKYESIRESLITFFECRGSHSPEDLADETINRVARRIVEGKQIYTTNPASYFYGVARNILKEQWTAPDNYSFQIDALHSTRELSVDASEILEREQDRRLLERRLECLQACLEALTLKNRDLINQYYQGESSIKVRNRKELAEKLGMSLNALRNKALRIREKLEHCVRDCLKRSS